MHKYFLVKLFTIFHPVPYDQLILDEGGESIQWSKDSLFHEWYWENWTSTCQKKNDPMPPIYTIPKNKPQVAKDSNGSCKIIKTLEEDIGKSQISHTAIVLPIKLVGHWKQRRK